MSMTSKDVLLDVIEGWKEDIDKEKVIYRDIMSQIEKSLDMEEVTVIRGVRRAGKTFIVYWLIQKHGGLYLNFEDERLYDFKVEDFEKVKDICEEKGIDTLYLDEVQEVDGWEGFAHRVHRKIKLVVTGSNSSLLASEYATALTGRTKSFTIFPLTYSGFLRFKEEEPSRKSFLEYTNTGGFPRVVQTGDRSLVKEYFERIIFRDILKRKNLRYPDALRSIALYLLSHVGKEFSYNSLKSVCKIKHDHTLKEYVGALKEAFLLDMISKYSPSLKKQGTYNKKIYSVDPLFSNLGKRMDDDHGLILENIVFLHLKRKYDLYFVKNHKEADFLLCDGLGPQRLVNVTYEAEEEETLKREVSSLQYFGKKFDVPLELVSVYPVKVPEEIDSRLAHRYLAEYN